VRAALARRAHCDPREIRPWHHLEQDLGLAPLDIVVAAVELGDLAGVEVAPEQLAAAATVADFAWIFLQTLRSRDPHA
jgi:hypothetical protein